MAGTERASRIVVFCSEDDRVSHHSLAEWLLEAARREGMAGATIWRAIEGFGSSGVLRTMRFPDAASGSPLALEVVDAPERIDGFLPVIAEAAAGCLVTREEISVSSAPKSVR